MTSLLLLLTTEDTDFCHAKVGCLLSVLLMYVNEQSVINHHFWSVTEFWLPSEFIYHIDFELGLQPWQLHFASRRFILWDNDIWCFQKIYMAPASLMIHVAKMGSLWKVLIFDRKVAFPGTGTSPQFGPIVEFQVKWRLQGIVIGPPWNGTHRHVRRQAMVTSHDPAT